MVEKRPIGSSGLEVAPLALGGNVFDWTADEPRSFAILDAFVDAGGSMIDTADVYSSWVPGHKGGESESLIGRWLKRDPAKRDKVVIATKVGYLDGEIVDGEFVASLEPDVIARACDASLGRLGIDTIDLYYEHKDSDTVPLADSLGAFELLREQGKIRSTGLSNFTADRVDEAVSTARTCGFMPAVALQPWYNMVARERFEGELREAAIRNGLAVFPFYSLANGFLTGKYRSPADYGKSAVRGARMAAYLEGKGPVVLAALDKIAAETGATLAQIALAWLAAQPGVTAPIASATSTAQLEELLGSIDLVLTPDQLSTLDAAGA